MTAISDHRMLMPLQLMFFQPIILIIYLFGKCLEDGLLRKVDFVMQIGLFEPPEPESGGGGRTFCVF